MQPVFRWKIEEIEHERRFWIWEIAIWQREQYTKIPSKCNFYRYGRIELLLADWVRYKEEQEFLILTTYEGPPSNFP